MAPLARRALFASIGGVWLASLALPAVELSSGTVYDGADLLRRGWAAASAGVLAWYANPLFVCGVVLGLLDRPRAAGVLAAAALVLGLTSFAAAPLARATGSPVPPLEWAPGFYVWLAALGALPAWSWIAARRGRAAGIAAGRPAQERTQERD